MNRVRICPIDTIGNGQLVKYMKLFLLASIVLVFPINAFCQTTAVQSNRVTTGDIPAAADRADGAPSLPGHGKMLGKFGSLEVRLETIEYAELITKPSVSPAGKKTGRDYAYGVALRGGQPDKLLAIVLHCTALEKTGLQVVPVREGISVSTGLKYSLYGELSVESACGKLKLHGVGATPQPEFRREEIKVAVRPEAKPIAKGLLAPLAGGGGGFKVTSRGFNDLQKDQTIVLTIVCDLSTLRDSNIPKDGLRLTLKGLFGTRPFPLVFRPST